MTREEAIKILKSMSDISTQGKAIDMAIEALKTDTIEFDFNKYHPRVRNKVHDDTLPTVIRSKTLMPTKDFREWAKRIKEVNPNAVVLPCDAEVPSADAVSRINYTPKPCENANCDCVEVVRCKDCRHRDLFSCPLADNDFQKDEDFCSWGERREP